MNIPVEEKEYRDLNIPSGDVQISTTDGCNMNCVYCHNKGQQDSFVKFLSVDDIKYLILNSMKYGLKKYTLLVVNH